MRTRLHPPECIRALAIHPVDEANLVLALDNIGASRSQTWVARYLHDVTSQVGAPGLALSLRTMVKESSIPVTTIRLAIRWLEREGYVARTRESIDGRTVYVTWCLWRIGGVK